MRIAIDARLNAYRQGGIPQYTRHLLNGLAEIAPDEQFISFQHRDMLRPLMVAPNVARRTAYTPPHHRYEQWTLPLEVARVRPDVLHCPDFIAPLRRTFAAVVTIHDLAFLRYPEILDDAARAYYGQIKASSARADGIIAVSESTRQDIVQLLDIPYDEIAVIHEAAAPVYMPMPLRPGEVRVLGDQPLEAGSFLLFVSTLEPRKNLPTLLRALRVCIDRRPERPYKLVIVGGRGWRDEPIFDAIRDLRLQDHLLLTGNLGQYDVRWLYNACRIYINPSLYEGFGLPLLEAMACGAPCLAAAASSLPEVGGEAVFYVAPLAVEAWADAIETMWDDEGQRAELGRRGMARAQQFSWQRAARETLAVYRAAVERRRGFPVKGFQSGVSSQGAVLVRPCPRCEAAMSAAKADDVHITLQGAPKVWQTDAPKTWTCPRCDYAELVVAHVPTLHDDAVLQGGVVSVDEQSISATLTESPATVEQPLPAPVVQLLHDVKVAEPLLEVAHNGVVHPVHLPDSSTPSSPTKHTSPPARNTPTPSRRTKSARRKR